MKLVASVFLTLIVTSGFSSLAAEKRSAKPFKPTNDDFGYMFTLAPTVESYFVAERIAKGDSAGLEVAAKSYGVRADSKLPRASMDGKFLKFEGLNVKFDLSKLSENKISDGKTTIGLNPSWSDAEKLKAFVEFYTKGKTPSASRDSSTCNPLIACAHAFDPNEAANVIGGTAGVVAGIGSAAMAWGKLLGWMATNALSHSTPFLPVAGQVTALVLASEGLIKAGIRSFKGSSIVCENGSLFLKTYDGKRVSLSNQGDGVLASVLDSFSHGQIGAVELNVRRALCTDKRLQTAFVQNLSAGFERGQTSTAPASDGRGAK